MRKKIFLFAFLIFSCLASFCQDKKDSIYAHSKSLITKGKYAEALAEFEQVKALFPKNGVVERSELYHKIGIEYYFEDSLALALIWWRDSALQKRIEGLGMKDFKTIKTLHNVAMAHRHLDQRTEEFKMTEKIIDQIQAGLKPLSAKDSSSLANKFFDYAILYRDIEDFQKAEQCLNQVASLIQNEKNTSRRARLNEYFGVLHNFKGDHQKAEKFLRKSIDIQASSNRYYNLAHVYYELNELDSAYLYARKVKQIYKEKKDKNQLDKQNLRLCLNLLGLINRKAGNYPKALANLQQSIAMINSNKENTLPNVGLAISQENIGETYFLQENHQQALAYYQEALTQLSSKASSLKNIKDNPLSDNIGTTEFNETIRVLGLKIKALYAAYKKDKQKEQLEVALQTSSLVDSLVRRFRLFNKKGEDKFSLSETVLPYYEYSILVAKEMYDNSQDISHLQKAYQALLNIKGINLMEEIKNKEILAQFVPKKVLKQESILREEVYAIENLLSIAQGAQKTALAQKYFTATNKYDQFLKEIAKAYPEYYHAKFNYQNTNSLAAIQQKLSASTLIFDFLEGDQAFYIFGISQEKISLEVFPNKLAIAQAIRTSNQATAQASIATATDFLYQNLLAKTLEQHPQNLGRLIFVKSGNLYDLAFDFLKTKDQKYLIEEYQLSELYSAEQLLQKPKRNHKDYKYIGFAIDYEQLKEQQRSFMDSLYLNQLSFVKEEINHGKTIFAGKAFLNQEVSIATLKHQLAQSNIIHFATHAISSQDALQSGLVVYDEQAQLSIFNKNDIMANNLSNDLILLSACHTGAGKKYKGEGVMSLARAFFNAGSKSVLVSTNAASDLSSQKILRAFLQHIQEGLSKDKALQLAKIDYFQNAAPAYQHPKYWAYFSIIGNTDSIEFPPAGWSKYIIVFAAILICALIFAIYQKKLN